MVPPKGSPSHRSVAQWGDAIAGPTVSPGGGSAAALAAGLAAAVVEMVAGLTGSREKYAAAHDEARRVRQSAGQLRQQLLGLAVQDAEVLERFTGALALPQGSDAERATRTEAKQSALREAAAVQLDLLGHAAGVAELAVAMAQKGLAGALGDSATAGFLAAGTARSAHWAIRSNLAEAGSDRDRPELSRRALDLLERAETAERRLREILSQQVP